jgi:hypothetical protein
MIHLFLVAAVILTILDQDVAIRDFVERNKPYVAVFTEVQIPYTEDRSTVWECLYVCFHFFSLYVCAFHWRNSQMGTTGGGIQKRLTRNMI